MFAGVIHRPSGIPGLVYELNPGSTRRVPVIKQAPMTIEINQHGMRGKAVLRAKPTGWSRIAVLGDSTTFGYGVEASETYSAVLETLIRSKGQRCEVLNFGVTGYNTRDEAIQLEHRVMAFEPDMLILGYNLNDPDTDHHTNGRVFFAAPKWWEHSHLTRMLNHLWWRQRRSRLGEGNLFRFLHATGQPNWAIVEDGFASIAATASGQQIPVLVVTFPTGEVPRDPENYRYADLHQQVAAEATKHGFEVLDLVRTFAEMRRRSLSYRLPHEHPNVAGHRAAALAIQERIDAMGVLTYRGW